MLQYVLRRYLGFSPLVPTSTGTVRYLGRPSVTRYWMSTLLYRLSGLVKFLGGSDCRYKSTTCDFAVATRYVGGLGGTMFSAK